MLEQYEQTISLPSGAAGMEASSHELFSLSLFVAHCDSKHKVSSSFCPH
jgi:hypothetical protein